MSSADRPTESRPPAPRPPVRWRTSSYSDRGNCVAVALLDGDVAVRNSNHPDAGTVHVAPPVLRTWIDGIKAGEFDHLTR